MQDLKLKTKSQENQQQFSQEINQFYEHKDNSSNNSYTLSSEKENEELVYKWNFTDRYFPHDKTLHKLFEEQASKTPNKNALVFNNHKITYKELNNKSNTLAHKIIEKHKLMYEANIKPDTIIGIHVERSLEMIIGLLGILKSGAAYVPLDINEPYARLKFKITDSKPKIIITQKQYFNKLMEITKSSTTLIDLNCETLPCYNHDIKNPESISKSSDTAYIIYTSGSTGIPKGVRGTHIGMVNRFYWMWNKYPFSNDEKCCLKTSISFVDFIWDAFGGLFSGIETFIAPYETYVDAKKLSDLIKEKKITRLVAVPTLLNELLIYWKNEGIPTSLKFITSSGESITKNIIEDLKHLSYRGKILNIYGSSEVSADSCCYEVKFTDKISYRNIGYPIDNHSAYILNDNLNPVSIHTSGELYIGGIGLANGYLYRDNLTKQYFIPNPFYDKENKLKKSCSKRIYKTGDICRRLPDGCIEFLGRKDHQIKIRGFRIELGEIENNIISHESISASAVIVKEGKLKNKLILAYYVSEKELSQEELKEFISKKLPDYMIPTIFIHLNKMPLNSSGKIDKNSLPEPNNFITSNNVLPRNKTEKRLLKIWKKVFMSDEIDIYSDFFFLGGDSIIAVKLSNAVYDASLGKITVSDILKWKNIAKIAKKLKKDEYFSKIKPKNVKDYPLSFAQERLFFINELENGTKAYNNPFCFKLKNNICITSLKNAVKSVVRRHSILHSIYKLNGRQEVIQVEKGGNFNISEFELDEKKLLDKISVDVNNIIDIKNNFPIKASIYKTQFSSYLLINVHHIAFDGWSEDIFIKEVKDFYNLYEKNISSELPNLDIQYRDFAIWQKQQFNENNYFKEAFRYWINELEGYEQLQLISDFPRPTTVSYNGENFSFNIDCKLTKSLRTFAKSKQLTLYPILLSSFYLLLHKYTGQNDLVIGTPVAGRDHLQLESLIGFFVNTIALRTIINENNNIDTLIGKIAEKYQKALQYQNYPFEKIVDTLTIQKELSKHPIFQIMFSVQSFGKTENSSDIFERFELNSIFKTAKFDISLFIDDSGENLTCNLNYCTALFKKCTIEKMANYYLMILDKVISTPSTLIQDLTLLSNTEYKDHLYKYNITETDYPHDKLLHELFEDQALSTPYNTAVEFSGKTLNYLEVSHASNRLANFITEYYEKINIAPGPCSFIGIYLDRSTDFVISVLGILKTGSAYVPLDTGDPESRLKYKIENSELKLIITSSSLSGRLSELSSEIKVFCLDSPKSDLKSYSSNFPLVRKSSTSPAYMIYTSGTTGHPKGVIIEHRSIVNYTNWIIKICNLNESDRSAFLLSPVWDGGLTVFYPSLLSGGSLCIGDEYLFSDPSELIRYLSSNRITFTKLTPSLFRHIAAHSENFRFNRSYLRYVILGGEALNINDIEKFHAVSPDTVFMNHYGPTETTVGVVYHLIDFNNIDIYRARSIIGKPIFNAKAYVLDKKLNPVPYNVEGELYIGGACVGRGYQNMPELTTERFIQSPLRKVSIIHNHPGCTAPETGSADYLTETLSF